jgi:hypothetical protein
VLSGWWSEEGPKTAATLEQGVHYTQALEIVRPEIEVQVKGRNSDTVVVEGLRIETGRAVRSRLEGHAWKPEPAAYCLVVQLRYPQGRPFLVKKPDGVAGGEHHFYPEANKYVGVFWDVTPDQASQQPKELRLISVEDCKKAAQEKGHHVEQRIGLSDPPRR